MSYPLTLFAPVAQLDRASAFEAECRKFESYRACHYCESASEPNELGFRDDPYPEIGELRPFEDGEVTRREGPTKVILE
jgi:hypothetical protein